MTREEHLVFCKKCLNRKFDPTQGIVCKLTDKIADFEHTCQTFERDESVMEEVNQPKAFRSNPEVIAELPDEYKAKLRSHQEPVFALVGGFSLAILAALLWAVVTVSTEYQIGFMAIGVGLIVGMGVRFFGAGIDPLYGYIGAFMAFLGCALGNLFSQVGFIANAQSMGYLDTLMLLDFGTIVLIYQESFSPMDLLFYGIAVFEGYKFAFRTVPTQLNPNEDLRPETDMLRLPLVITCFLIVSFAGYYFSKGVSGKQTFYYESGAILSSGELTNGRENGPWQYFYESGRTQLKGDYLDGKENGKWQWYYESGDLMQEGSYANGLFDGMWNNYYPDGNLSESTSYKGGRMDGSSILYYENGQIWSKGEYVRDRQEGVWETYYDNGSLQSKGSFKDGDPVGEWEFWTLNGENFQKVEYINAQEFKIINHWAPDGKLLVKGGNGQFESYYNDGSLLTSGKVSNGIKVGVWETYYPDGQLKEQGEYRGNQYLIMNTWATDGKREVRSGNGAYTIYFENSEKPYQTGQVKNGLKEGLWETYFDHSIVIQQQNNYTRGKLHGKSVTYYQNGNVLAEGSFENDKRTGEWKWYYESGLIQCSATFIDDKKDGAQVFWSESGLQAKEEIYENGELVGENLL